jgi:hypothetical protein
VRKPLPSSPSPRSRARTRSLSSRSRARGERVGHTDPAATSRRCALCSRNFRPRPSFAAPCRKRASSGWPGDKVANRLTTLRPTSPIPAAGSVFNPTLARLERDFIRAIHNTQESGGHQKELNTKRRPGTEASEITPGPVRGVGEVSVPDSEIGCCVPLRRYRRRGVGADGHAAAVTSDPSLYARRRDGIAPGPVLEFATSFCGPYFSNFRPPDIA